MNNINPIDFALAICLATFEAVLWVINELLGYHVQATKKVTEQVTEQVKPHVQPLHEALTELTVKQLRAITGIKSSRYNKADLVMVAVTC